MIHAAGILFVTPQGKALFLQRGLGGDFPGHWCTPGGRIEGDETALQAAERECLEETKWLPEGERKLWTRRVAIDASPNHTPESKEVAQPPEPPQEVDFTTFLQKIDSEFVPTLNEEHVAYCWAPITSPPQPLHPGCFIALARFSLDELGVAKAIRDGQLTSPQRYENVSLFAMRITGTGTAYRKSLDEFVYRRPENYLTPEFLERCNGLPVILKHPDKATLDSKEYAERIIGAIFLPYVVGEEVWGIAKIYDDEAVEIMEKYQLSTSPSVVFRDPSVNSKLELDNGATLLIEGKPSLLDHLAVCEQGVWDKGEDPNGINVRGDSVMTEVRADAARKDEPAEREEMAERIKEKEKEGAKKKDAKKDEFPEDLKKKDEDDKDEKKEDEDDKDEKKSDADGGEKLDKVLAHLDSFSKRMDALEAEEEKKDAEGSEEIVADKKKDAKADSTGLTRDDVAGMIADVAKKIPKALTDEDYNAMADAQSRADSVYAAHGNKAPRPLDGETPVAYRRRLANGLKSHSKTWGEVDLGHLNDKALSVAEQQIFSDAMTSASTPIDLQPGVLRQVSRRDATGREVITFVGKNTIFSALGRPSRRVTRLSPPPVAN